MDTLNIIFYSSIGSHDQIIFDVPMNKLFQGLIMLSCNIHILDMIYVTHYPTIASLGLYIDIH